MAPPHTPTPPGTLELVRRQLDYWWINYRRTYRGSLVSSFGYPLFIVLAMGVLLGSYVRPDPARLEGAPSYLAFVAPGLLAANAMLTAFGESTYPVVGRLKWDRTYYAMQASPLRPADIVAGHLAYQAACSVLNGAVFVLVLAPFGVFVSVTGALLALGASVLTGAAFAAAVYAFSAGLDDEQVFGLLYRLGAMPLFLFSGAFFPVADLSPVLEALARLTPLWHGVDLARMSALGTWQPGPALVHVVYLVAMTVVCHALAVRRLSRRLEV